MEKGSVPLFVYRADSIYPDAGIENADCRMEKGSVPLFVYRADSIYPDAGIENAVCRIEKGSVPLFAPSPYLRRFKSVITAPWR